MYKNLNRIVFLFFSVLVLVSCTIPKPVLSENKIHRITIPEIQNTVFIHVTQAEPGRSLKSLKVRLENNKLNIDYELEQQELYAFEKLQQIKYVQDKPINFINYLTFFQKVQISFWLFFSLVLLYYYSRFTKLKNTF